MEQECSPNTYLSNPNRLHQTSIQRNVIMMSTDYMKQIYHGSYNIGRLCSWFLNPQEQRFCEIIRPDN